MLSIAGVMAVHNGADTLRAVLASLAANHIELHVLDHGSSDDTPAILRSGLGTTVATLAERPFDGVFRLADQLRWKESLIASLDCDWVIHIDADEILESPVEGETLRGFIERTDAAGFDIIDCHELIFTAVDADEDHAGGDFVASMRRYYPYRRKQEQTFQRAFRRGNTLSEWLDSGGHKVARGHSVAEEKLIKRHYIGLSHNRLQACYLSRVFDGEELRRGWHRNRVATTPQFIRLPPADRMLDLDRDGLRTDPAETTHLIFDEASRYRAPPALVGTDRLAPMPFVVGVGRSGTTLLRLLMDAHPDLAMTPESHWLGAVIDALAPGGDVREIVPILRRSTHWGDMGIDDACLDRVISTAAGSPDRFDVVRGIYRCYASRFGASRVGDKTPPHGLKMVKIAGALPEAHFIHIIRDGRDVAVSYRDLWFGPGNDPEEAARFWVWRVREMRQQAQFLPNYMEVRYEALVHDPEAVLKAICDFVRLPYQASQLRAHETAAARLAEMKDVVRGELHIPAERRRALHHLTLAEPQTSQVGRWRREMSRNDVAAFESIAAPMLRDLGYPVG